MRAGYGRELETRLGELTTFGSYEIKKTIQPIVPIERSSEAEADTA